jgi:hypothetical protein
MGVMVDNGKEMTWTRRDALQGVDRRGCSYGFAHRRNE